jgi:hypothetical protein
MNILRKFNVANQEQRSVVFRELALKNPLTTDADSSLRWIMPVLPTFQIPRLSSQQGCFLWNCQADGGFEDSLSAMMNGVASGWLWRVTFPTRLCEEFLRRLMILNVHPVTLFPDLDGLANFVNLKSKLFPASESTS